MKTIAPKTPAGKSAKTQDCQSLSATLMSSAAQRAHITARTIKSLFIMEFSYNG